MTDWPEDFAAEWRADYRAERAYRALRSAFALRRHLQRKLHLSMLVAMDGFFSLEVAAYRAQLAVEELRRALLRADLAMHAHRLAAWRFLR